MPCFDHLYGKDMSYGYSRIEMCDLVFSKDPKIKTSDIEMSMQCSGTYSLLNSLDYFFDAEVIQFSLLIGSDNAKSFNRWKNYEKIIEEVPIYVVLRDDEKEENIPKPFKVIGSVQGGISSTLVRNLVKEKKSISHLVHPDVEKYILDKKLYTGE
jgi:nicotinate-nucleotide adenylyltransferase